MEIGPLDNMGLQFNPRKWHQGEWIPETDPWMGELWLGPILIFREEDPEDSSDEDMEDSLTL